MQLSSPTSSRGRSRSSQQFDQQVAGFSPKAPQQTHHPPGVISQPRGHRVAAPSLAAVRGVGRGAGNSKQFKCSFCDILFSTKGNKVRHEQATHLHGVRTYPCEVCGKEFKRKEDRTMHMRVHTGRSYMYLWVDS
ncbi:unnamed protein product [Ectocarpus sp. CCAP 1310/34]|nr:unnamed protein product [Ectocarpus sp. CCAP 1310/34]